jgi:hypothetical protein
MKKQTFLFFAVVLIATVTQAQFSFGPKAGINISKEKYSNTAVYSTGSHSFFTGGAFANYLFKKHIATELGVYYSAEGTEENYKSNGTTVSGVVTIKRINIPLLFQYHSAVGVYFETGPQIGLMVSAKGEYTNGQFDFKKYTQSTLMSWCVGAGYKLSKALAGLGINASYAAGLSRIDKGNVNAGKITGSTFTVRLLYAFKLQNIKK